MEWRKARPVVIGAVLVAIGTVTGPFGTFAVMSYGERFLYWSIAILSVGLPINLLTPVAIAAKPLQNVHLILRIFLGCLLGTMIGTLVILSLDVWFGRATFIPLEYWVRFKFVLPISFGISFVENYMRPRTLERLIESQTGSVPDVASPQAHSEDGREAAFAHPLPEPLTRQTEPPLFLRNLDDKLGTELISISTEDHYLRVVTRDGEDRILKRMSDALAELEDYPGLQIHRSHWIALDAVDRVEREGRKCHVVLEDGTTLPVSRPNIPALTEALAERV